MEERAMSENVVLLLDDYSMSNRRLHESLQHVNNSILAIVIAENDFLPESVLSIFDLMIGNYRNGKMRNIGKPKYFNEISAPDTWSFHAGDEKSGNITHQQVEKGRIHYVDSPKRRVVQKVEWYDRAGVTRFCDYYNRYGDICARTVHDAEGRAISKTWLSPEGQEVIVENYMTHDIILNDENFIKLFQSKEELTLYYLKKLGFNHFRIFFASLASSFFLANRLETSGRNDVLFWQETAGEEIPWNMRLILEGRACRCNKVVVQTRNAYRRLLELGVGEDKIQRLGFIYPFKKENGHQPEALICTNSDKIEHCEELIKRLPGMHFHIAALTWMSPTLFELGRYDNVDLYPGIEPLALEELFAKCDYYFDINYYAEIVSAVFEAFLHNQLIFAFQETIHNREYVADVFTYPVAEFEKMVSDVQTAMTDKTSMDKYLEKQQDFAFAENKETYIKVLGI